MISCEVNQTGRGRGHSDDNAPSDKSGYVGMGRVGKRVAELTGFYLKNTSL